MPRILPIVSIPKGRAEESSMNSKDENVSGGNELMLKFLLIVKSNVNKMTVQKDRQPLERPQFARKSYLVNRHSTATSLV